MAPEQVRSPKTVDHRADIWGLGLILYEMLAGRPPFEGESSTSLLAAIMVDEPPSVSTLRPDAPPELAAIVDRCMAKRPERRYQTVADLAFALEGHAFDVRARVARIARLSDPARAARPPTEGPVSIDVVIDPCGQTEMPRTDPLASTGSQPPPAVAPEPILAASLPVAIRPPAPAVPPPAPALPRAATPEPPETTQTIQRTAPLRVLLVTLILAAMANLLGLLPISGPLNIQFGLTPLPILLAAFTLGPAWGALCGLLGGNVQADAYGHWAYIVYTGVQGGVAGLLAKDLPWTRRLHIPIGFAAGVLLAFWLDLLRASPFTLNDLGTSFADAPRVFGDALFFGRPAIAFTTGVVMAVAAAGVGRGMRAEGDRAHLFLAGCAVAYVPYDAWVLYGLQGYPWLPAWFVLAKDLVQDFLAAWLCAAIVQDPRVRRTLAGR